MVETSRFLYDEDITMIERACTVLSETATIVCGDGVFTSKTHVS